MGWFSSTPSTAQAGPTAKPTSDGGFEAPTRSARTQCYESRDIFFECLDEHNILDSVTDDALARKKCPKELKYFEKDCASTWVRFHLLWEKPGMKLMGRDVIRLSTSRRSGSWNTRETELLRRLRRRTPRPLRHRKLRAELDWDPRAV
jgi:cytochrome c oxidase assembly factor 6